MEAIKALSKLGFQIVPSFCGPMIHSGLGDEGLTLDGFGSTESAAPWTGIESPRCEPGAPFTSFFVQFLEHGANSSTWTVSVYGGMDPLFKKTDASGAVTKYVYANGMRVARITGSGSTWTTYSYHVDAMGSTWHMTDASRTVVFSTAYEPFGRPSGTTVALASTERCTFLGERHDTVTGQTYLRARQYDSTTGRFTSMDPVLGSLGMPEH